MWSEKKCAGLALGALLWGDRSLSCTAGTLPAQALASASQRLSKLESGEGPEPKRRLVRALVDEVRGDLLSGAEQLPPRARALLARHVPREQGRRLLQDALEARVDFVAPAELVQTLLHLARTHGVEADEYAREPPSELEVSERNRDAATPPQS